MKTANEIIQILKDDYHHFRMEIKRYETYVDNFIKRGDGKTARMMDERVDEYRYRIDTIKHIYAKIMEYDNVVTADNELYKYSRDMEDFEEMIPSMFDFIKADK